MGNSINGGKAAAASMWDADVSRALIVANLPFPIAFFRKIHSRILYGFIIGSSNRFHDGWGSMVVACGGCELTTTNLRFPLKHSVYSSHPLGEACGTLSSPFFVVWIFLSCFLQSGTPWLSRSYADFHPTNLSMDLDIWSLDPVCFDQNFGCWGLGSWTHGCSRCYSLGNDFNPSIH